ncbi:MAG TPA: pseudouridine synthase, partial [Segetibacter sp.]|nr:pseudouridine synthase [Segetibacter sp.]
MLHYFIVYKPFQVLSQFTSEGGKTCLSDVFDVPGDVYPVGRLDYDSEGLLILSNDRQLNHLLLDPRHKHEREYW